MGLRSTVIDTSSEEYIEGKEMIKLVHSMAAGEDGALADEDHAALMANADTLAFKLQRCLRMTFRSRPADSDDTIDIPVLSVTLAALMALYRLPDVAARVS